MPRPRKHECTSHNIRFCPDTKEIIEIEKARMSKTRVSVSFTEVIEKIVMEWSSLKSEMK